MKKLYIHIYTLYENRTNDERKLLWNEEIKEDAETVHSVFQNYTIIDLEVSIATDKKDRKYRKDRYVNCIVDPLKRESLADYEECHIVLNTHGAAGSNDLSDEIVKEIVTIVSDHGIKIQQISALQCNGLRGQTPSEYRRANPDTPAHNKVKDKPSAMSILQEKLNTLETKCQQSFSISGFVTAYDPKEKDLVKNLLLNGSETSLSVTTKKAQSEDFKNLQNCIMLCRSETDKKSKKYVDATNTLGKILHKITANICDHLEWNSELYPGSVALYKAILFELPNSENKKLSVSEFKRYYKKWLQKYKMSTEQRLDVLEAYCNAGMRSQDHLLESSASALCQGGVGMFNHQDIPNIVNLTPTAEHKL